MLETLSVLPPSFWMATVLVLAGIFWSFGQIKTATGLPMLAVLGTVATWYMGDALYNDYANYHAKTFTPATLAAAWWQVAWFLTAFLVLTPVTHRLVNRRYLGQGGQVYRMLGTGAGQPSFQLLLNQLFWGCGAVWLALMFVALVRLRGEFPYFFFPYLSHGADPWSRGRVGA